MEPTTEKGPLVIRLLGDEARRTRKHEAATNDDSRVACFIDIPNLETSAYEHQATLEPKLLREIAVGHGRLVAARAYGFASPNKGVSRAVVAAAAAGFEFMPRVARESGRKDIDTQLTADIVEFACLNLVDVFVLASGDSDFLPAVRAAHRAGKAVVVVAVDGSCSQALAREADEAVLLVKEETAAPSSETTILVEVGR